tara:strand:+ start:1058 stop:1639 length:582 start_codon:yes stop_codon:yes gene_type:complete
MEICKLNKKKILILLFIFLSNTCSAENIFENLTKKQKTSYLDFVLLKIESRLIQRHTLLGSQMVPVRVQFQSIGSQVDFIKKENKILINVIGVMNKRRYQEKKYIPNIVDCNILRNVLLYGKQGYSVIFKKRNKFLTNSDMEEIFISRFLNNLSITEEEKKYIMNNTNVLVEIKDPVRGNDISCKGAVAQDLN